MLVILLGLWLMASPDVMEYSGPERINNHVAGPLIISIAMIAMAETMRAVRWINVVLGCWLIAAPVALGYEPLHIGVSSSLVGTAVFALSLIEGSRRERLGGGWSRLWRNPDDKVGECPAESCDSARGARSGSRRAG